VTARLLSVNVGLPRDVAWAGKTVHTAVWKEPVRGRRMARRLNIDGDGQGDLAGHGGEHRAVFVYQIDSYRYWQSELRRNDFTHGQFGENFTVDGLSDQEVCIGDRYRIGSALFEVTQPRVTCYRIGIRMNEPQMAALLVARGRPGFYFRVLKEGEVEADDEIVQVAAGPERMTVFEVNALLYLPGHPRSQLERALRIPALSAGWRASLQALLEQERSGGAITGNAGLAPGSGPPPAWAGFRPLRVSHKIRESSSVISLVLEPMDGHPLTAALPGQFVVLRLRPAPDASALMRAIRCRANPMLNDTA
jgi:MOSC domain-containing protein YiiM